MGYWKIIVPELGYNKVLSPSAETGNNIPTYYANYNGATSVVRYSLDAFKGFQCYQINTNASGQGIGLTLDTLANAIHTLTFALGSPPSGDETAPGIQVTVDGGAHWHTPELLYTGYDGDWHLYTYQFPAAECNGSTTLRIRQSVAGALTWYIDRVQVEENEYWTTYMDGDEPGCEWEGYRHASVTRRSAFSRAGGRARDLADVYHFDIESMDGAGVPPNEHYATEYAFLPGGDVARIRDTMRPITLTGTLENWAWNDVADVRGARKDLIALLKADSEPYKLGRPQPARFWYTEGSDYPPRYIDLHYEEGLRLGIHGRAPCHERLALRFVAEDPYFYQNKDFGRSVQARDWQANTRLLFGRVKDDEDWDNFGPPNAAGTYTVINAIVIGPDGKLYIGGNFTSFDNIAGADYFCRYDFDAATWELAGPGSSVNNIVRRILPGPGNVLYLCGAFTNLGGANGDCFSRFFPSTNTFSSLGDITGGGAATLNAVNDAAMDGYGNIWIVGDFLDVGASVNADYIARWTGATWTDAGLGAAPCTVIMYAVDVDASNRVWVGGSQANIGGVADADRIAYIFEGVVYAAVPGGGNAAVYTIEVGPDQSVYCGGAFTTLGGNTDCNYIGRIKNGQAFALAQGFDNYVHRIAVAPDGLVYAAGDFAWDANGDWEYPSIAAWNGYAWTRVADIGGGNGRVVHCGPADPASEGRYDLFIGGNFTGSSYAPGRTAFDYPGTQAARPRLRYYDPASVSADLYIARNETLGLNLFLAHEVRVDEDFYIDLRRGRPLAYGTIAGEAAGAVLPGSDVQDFRIIPGHNVISLLVAEDVPSTFISIPIRFTGVD